MRRADRYKGIPQVVVVDHDDDDEGQAAKPRFRRSLLFFANQSAENEVRECVLLPPE